MDPRETDNPPLSGAGHVGSPVATDPPPQSISGTGAAARRPSAADDPTPPLNRVRNIVDEIRQRLTDVSAREQSLIRREQELSERIRRFERDMPANRMSELSAAEHQLETRSAELNFQAVEISARR